MNITWSKQTLSFVLLLALLLPAGMTAQAAIPARPVQFDCGTVTEIPQTECEALVALYESTDGANWTNNNNWLATNTPCSWYGVTCSADRVLGLWLFNNNLNGQITPLIGNLAALESLDLSLNQLSGSIPIEIGGLTALTDLVIWSNQLSGTIPPEIGNLTALTNLDLPANRLSGSIPPEIGNLVALEEIRLSGNQLSGAIPSAIGNLTALTRLTLNQNQLSGSIPPEIGDLTALTYLNLADNQLSGPIPPEIGNLAALEQLYLNRNQLTSLPPQIGNLAALTWIEVNFNQLSGSIPPEIGNLTALRGLRLWSNRLSGPIPPEIGNLAALEQLQLNGNQLSGEIPPEIGNLTSLKSLALGDKGGNQLSGPIPSEIGNLTALEQIFLTDNQLTGPIPPEIGNLTKLHTLYLGGNQLSGPIPAEISNLTTLGWLDLHGNLMSGELPAFLTSLTQLNFFLYYDTELCTPLTGDMPTWLSGISYLYGTGLICDEGLGSLAGTVTLTNTMPAEGVQVNLYRSPAWPWQLLSTTHTTADGTYQFTGLGQGLGIDYRVQFVDPTHQMALQYYDAKSTINAADVITITPGVPRTGIDAVLALPALPAVDVDTETGAVIYDSDGTARITMPASNLSDITITRAVTCTAGTPSTVTLSLSTGPQYPMANVGDDLYQATIPAAALIGNTTLSVAAACGVITTETTVGSIALYDPSGIVTDAQTGEPVAGATVTLYNVPGWLPKSSPDDDRPNTCESNLSKPEGTPWSQPAPTHLGIVAYADVVWTAPRLHAQLTTADGYYGWDVSEGCWYVSVEAEGYKPLVSPVVGVPPEVTDLDLALTPVSTACPAPLTDVGIVGPLDITSTLYINTLYTFQAVITPTDASEPITYTWSPEPQTGQGTDTATYRWSTPDTYTITLTAENCGGSVSTTRTFVIEDKDAFTVYLPLVQRNFSLCGTIPTLLSPANESILNTLIPLFRWDNGAATAATTGRLQVARDPDFLQPVTMLTYGGYPGEHEFRFARNFDPGATYYWRVWLLCGDLQGPYSDVWSFTAGSGGVVLPAPTLVAPSNNSTQPATGVTLQWTPVSGATGYVVRWGKTDTGGYNYHWVAEASYYVHWLDGDTTYRWWVSAYNDYAIGTDSETWRFTTTSASAAETNSETFIGFRVENGDVIELNEHTK